MTTLESLQKILIAHYPVQIESITRDAELQQLDIDSLGIMELFFAIEDEFGVSVPNDKRDMRTVGDLVDYIDELRAVQLPQQNMPAAIGQQGTVNTPGTTP